MTTKPLLGLVIPAAFFALSSVAFLFAVQLPQRNRVYFAPLLFGSAVFSLANSTYLSALFLGAPSYWNLLICIWIHHAASVLFIDAFKFPHTAGLHKRKWLLAYKIWADPQRQLNWSSYLQNREVKQTTFRKRSLFALLRTTKVAVCWTIQLQVIGPAIPRYLQVTVADFSPVYHPFLSRLLWSSSGPIITLREVEFRAIMSIYWIWLAFLMLDSANIVLSIIFASIFGLDAVEEWKPLFGSPLHGSSIRGFWAKFWHRLASPSCAVSGRFITHRIMRFAPNSTFSKIFTVFWTFFVSGVIHVVADWQGGEAVMPVEEMQFWLANFAAGTVETLFVDGVRRLLKSTGSSRVAHALQSSILRKAFGFLWVFAFLFWMVPSWQYPKFYAVLTPVQQVSVQYQ